MDQPLGRTVGNSLEVRECLEILRGQRQPMSEDLRALSLELAAWMFYLGGRANSVAAGRALGGELINSGKALNKFCQMCRLQGAGASFNGQPDKLPSAKHTAQFKASADGFIQSIQCEQIGLASLLLGGGRNKQDDLIDHAVGLEMHKKTGHPVKNGETIATVHYNDSARFAGALQSLKEACRIGPKPAGRPRKLVRKVIHHLKS
jgi:thymidine phosphorylase